MAELEDKLIDLADKDDRVALDDVLAAIQDIDPEAEVEQITAQLDEAEKMLSLPPAGTDFLAGK